MPQSRVRRSIELFAAEPSQADEDAKDALALDALRVPATERTPEQTAALHALRIGPAAASAGSRTLAVQPREECGSFGSASEDQVSIRLRRTCG